MEKKSGAEILIECLKEQNVNVIFGYPGGAVLNIYDALYKHQDEITHYRTAHEQGAAHAADGYARATGRVGVCLATSGPGATNLVTGIAAAYMDSIPLVAITGNVSVPLLGKDSFQEVDIAGITMPITKHNYIVKDVRHLADILRKAFAIAREGRPGPVLVDIPKDVTERTAFYSTASDSPVTRRSRIRLSYVEKAAELIRQSERPLLYTGGGVVASGASEVLQIFAQTIDAPVASSLMGLGGFPGTNTRFTGLLGIHGTEASNFAAAHCDLFIAAGVRFSDRALDNVAHFVPEAPILRFDIDPAEISKNTPVCHAIVGDLKEIFSQLTPMLAQADHTPWTRAVAAKSRDPLPYPRDGVLRPQFILERIGALRKPWDIVVTDVGQHQMWACQYMRYEQPRTFISSGGLGAMGFGLGAAIGAAIGCPERTVFNIAGDGCFGMNSIELATAVTYEIPVIEVILNNHALGMVRQWQDHFYGSRYSHTDMSRATDFCKLAEAYQAAAFSVTRPDQVDDVLQEAIQLRKPVVINCDVGEEESVGFAAEQSPKFLTF